MMTMRWTLFMMEFMLLFFKIACEPTEEISSFVEDHPEHECVYQLKNEDLLYDDVGEVN